MFGTYSHITFLVNNVKSVFSESVSQGLFGNASVAGVAVKGIARKAIAGFL